MKNILLALALFMFSIPSFATPETKKVCIEVKDKDGKPVKDAKTGKVKESCKDVKIHKKLEGTEVPKK